MSVLCGHPPQRPSPHEENARRNEAIEVRGTNNNLENKAAAKSDTVQDVRES